MQTLTMSVYTNDEPTVQDVHVSEFGLAPQPRPKRVIRHAQLPVVAGTKRSTLERSVSWELGVLIVALAAFVGVLVAMVPYALM